MQIKGLFLCTCKWCSELLYSFFVSKNVLCSLIYVHLKTTIKTFTRLYMFTAKFSFSTIRGIILSRPVHQSFDTEAYIFLVLCSTDVEKDNSRLVCH